MPLRALQSLDTTDMNADKTLMGEWRTHGHCSNLTPAEADRIFFPTDTSEDAWTEARELCSNCPVAAQCLADVTKHAAPYGMWAGLTPQEREQQGLPTKGTRSLNRKGRKHGTYSKWNDGCRCDDCVEAKRTYTRNQMREWRRWKGTKDKTANVRLPTY